MDTLVLDPNTTRRSLLVRLRDSRDDQAWADFISLYEPVIYRVAKSRGSQDADCREIVQEVLLSVSKSISEFNPDSTGSFRGWLTQITRNATIDHFRRQSLREQATGDSNVVRRMDATAESNRDIPTQLIAAFDAELRRQLFRQAAAEIRKRTSEQNWIAFWRTCVENHSVSEVAGQLGITEGAVYVAKCRILKRIREYVHQHEVGSES
ncbi:MAG: sigma-70 family RNA polymerase sigma factor [Planctomycetota bacterium]